ncbi:lanthionine synthetase C family protein [Streptomyces varsoviensis]|uniref:lanthionine synthetase C family protein n=1 Tax=Streptomyces varsoviensis TaxID=67373 RepID=UPI0033C4BCA8
MSTQRPVDEAAEADGPGGSAEASKAGGAAEAADRGASGGPQADGPPRADRATAARAASVVAELAGQLADPDAVVAVATAEGNVDRPPGRDPVHPWGGVTLAEGHPGVALLFAELAQDDPRHRAHAHAHLALAARALSASHGAGLYVGAPSLALAACAARRGPGDYATLLDRLDSRIEARVRQLLAAEDERLAARRAGASMDVYDLILGLAGIGRYLLLRADRHRDALTDTLAYLVRLTEPVRHLGHTVPGWWVPGAPGLGQEAHFPRGHFNLGLAHGICGPLALFALAEEAGVSVPGQREAATRIVDWLLGKQAADLSWPAVVSWEDELAGVRPCPASGRSAWCYGTPGVAHTVHLAGRAWGRDDWRRTAVDALTACLDGPQAVVDCGLCHGWSGLLQIACRMARDSRDERLPARLPHLAERVLAAYDPALPLGYRYADTPPGLWAPHRAGFLEGTAGIALSLHTYASGGAPRTPWDAALLLA